MEELILVPGLLMTILPAIPFVTYSFLKSRSRELEADYIGLLLMTEAGYDPAAAISIHEAVAKWQEQYFKALKQQHGVDKRPGWLDTHPNVQSSQDRVHIP